MTKVVDKQLELAKVLYLKYTPLNSISLETGMTKSQLVYYIPKWRAERELLKSEVLEALSESKRELMSSIAKNGLEVLAKSMEDLVKRGAALSPKEMSGIAAIVDSLDKITKLDDGNPTEIIAETKPATTIEIRKLLNRDPFLELPETIDDATINEPSTNSSNTNHESSGSGNSP